MTISKGSNAKAVEATGGADHLDWRQGVVGPWQDVMPGVSAVSANQNGRGRGGCGELERIDCGGTMLAGLYDQFVDSLDFVLRAIVRDDGRRAGYKADIDLRAA